MFRPLRAILILVAVALGAGACSSSPPAGEPAIDARGEAESMIGGELATTIGLGPLTGECGDPGPLGVGVTFACTATTEPGQTIDVAATVNAEGHLELTTRNLISAAALPSFERQAAAVMNDTVGSNFTVDSVDCGNTAMVLPPDFTLMCALVMPASGEVFDLTLTITDLDARNFSLVVGDQPRP
ncbi:MAG: hypothetical protein ACFCVK_26395 [Acidimicrobiales bacterium]